MPEESLQSCAYHVVRYQPNLIRDEWINIGVLLFDPSSGRVRQRWLEESADFARLRRLHPSADEELLLGLPAEFDRQFAGREMDAAAILEKFDETLSNAVQLSPRKGVLARDPDAALERIFREQVEPVRESRRGAAEIRTRSDLRAQAADYFRSEKILRLMDRSVRVAEFTYPGDPMRIDFSCRRNGTRGFVHTLSVTRAPQDAKSLAYNVKHIADKANYHTEFAAVTDVRLARENDRHRFVLDTLGEAGIEPVPTEGLAVWVAKLRPSLLQ